MNAEIPQYTPMAIMISINILLNGSLQLFHELNSITIQLKSNMELVTSQTSGFL